MQRLARRSRDHAKIGVGDDLVQRLPDIGKRRHPEDDVLDRGVDGQAPFHSQVQEGVRGALAIVLQAGIAGRELGINEGLQRGEVRYPDASRSGFRPVPDKAQRSCADRKPVHAPSL